MDVIVSENSEILHLMNIKEPVEEILKKMADKAFSFPETVADDNKKYKCSVFNYCYDNGSNVLIYNTLYNSLVRMEYEEYQVYQMHRINESADGKDFVNMGLWIEDDVDEMQRYLEFTQLYKEYITHDEMSLSITTTTKCNARCPYCYENGIKQLDMYPGAVDKIYRLIEAKAVNKLVELTWFGGEPLMNTRIIDDLIDKLIENDFNFSSFFITNGSLFDDKIIEEKVDKWHVQSVQITLDGTKVVYEKRKNYINTEQGNFYNVLNNIRMLAEKNIHVSIRINIDQQNRDDVMQLLEQIDPIYSSFDNVVFYPAFVVGGAYSMSETEKLECVREMLERISDVRKLMTGTNLYSMPRMNSCMKEEPNSYCVDVYGNIYNCEQMVGRTENAIGTLEDIENLPDRIENKILEDECKECVFFPKCYGGCIANKNAGDVACMIEKYIISAYMQII
ncbi:radical SAM additional 4Fe4S-binding SPASM domain protein [Roseburia sp. CAG:380]|nr:radical SAM additional 4Fe4S-binding SPASM domain protein [Roseburia sp. CAG:380]